MGFALRRVRASAARWTRIFATTAVRASVLPATAAVDPTRRIRSFTSRRSFHQGSVGRRILRTLLPLSLPVG